MRGEAARTEVRRSWRSLTSFQTVSATSMVETTTSHSVALPSPGAATAAADDARSCLRERRVSRVGRRNRR